MTTTTQYPGTIERWIPASAGFQPVPWEDAFARARAGELARATLGAGGRAGTLGDGPGGDAMPLWTYRDERVPGRGVYRFFRYAHPAGEAIGALRFVGTLGAAEDPGQILQDSPAYAAAQEVAKLDRTSLCTAGNPIVSSFQLLYNTEIDGMASDPSFAGPLPAKITVDGKYGNDTHNALDQTLGGGAPDACAAFTGGGGGGGTGQTTSEPVPADDGACHYVPDATNAMIVSTANSISYQNTPVTWRDQGSYATTTPDGTKWLLVMWWESGHKMVAAYRCEAKGTPTPPPTPPPSTSSSSGGAGTAIAVVLGLLAAAGGAWAYSSQSR